MRIRSMCTELFQIYLQACKSTLERISTSLHGNEFTCEAVETCGVVSLVCVCVCVSVCMSVCMCVYVHVPAGLVAWDIC